MKKGRTPQQDFTIKRNTVYGQIHRGIGLLKYIHDNTIQLTPYERREIETATEILEVLVLKGEWKLRSQDLKKTFNMRKETA